MTTAAFKFNTGRPEVILPSGDTYPVLYGNQAAITDFGGSPNASSSTNTTAILRAAGRVNDDGGGVVRFPGGMYEVDVPSLRFLNYANVTFIGESRYSSVLIDPQDMATSSLLSVPAGPNAFITFADCTKCTVMGLGFSGANEWSQARINSGVSVLNRKGVYFEYLSAGCSDCGLVDVYMENIEGEAAFADGDSNRLRILDSHFYRCQTNVVNWGRGDSIQAMRNVIQDPGQSPFQVGGTNYFVLDNVATMSVDPNTGLTWVTAGTPLLVYNTRGAHIRGNTLSGFRFSSTLSAVSIGSSDIQTVADVDFSHNILERITIGTGAGDFNGIIALSAINGILRNINVHSNIISGCGGTTSGGAFRTAIRVSGGLELTGCIGPNFISNASLGSLDVGVHFMGTVGAGNMMRLESQRIPAGGVSIAPVVMDAASGDDARIFVGTKTWDPGNVNDGAMTSTTVNTSGARLGDGATVSFNGLGLVAGLQFTAIATNTDLVTVTLFNKSGGPVDLGSGTLVVHVQRT